MLMGKLKARGLHFLVPPYNAAAQVRYLMTLCAFGLLLTATSLHTLR